MTKPSRLELPPGVQLVYLAEGGANVIFQFVSTPANSRKRNSNQFACPVQPSQLDHSNLPPELRGKLLRLRKDTPSASPYQETARNFDKIIRPLFSPQELVDQSLVHLPKGLLQRCNEQLQVLEVNDRRPAKRHGVYLAITEPYGLLVTDMTARGDPATVVAELKPKWLLQSPSAPPNARKCRTCALRDMKNHESTALGGLKSRMFCPLDLVSDKFENVLRATSLLRDCQDRLRLARLLVRNNTLLKLQSHQNALQDVGLYGPSSQSREKSLAMTLRDCTMFIKVRNVSRTHS